MFELEGGDPALEPSCYEGVPDLAAHAIDFAEAYSQVQVAIVPTRLDDVYDHPDPIQRDKWHTAIQKELQMIKWKSSPSLAGVADDAADLFTMEMPGEYWMLIKKFIWKTKDMDKVSQE